MKYAKLYMTFSFYDSLLKIKKMKVLTCIIVFAAFIVMFIYNPVLTGVEKQMFEIREMISGSTTIIVLAMYFATSEICAAIKKLKE